MEQTAQIPTIKRRGRPRLPQGEKKQVISVAIDPDLVDTLSDMAEKSGSSQSEIMREALRQYVATWDSDTSRE
jgi:metal-responsive CopG/Arc/MetJ family transcriptional regulator